tara:strand:+ start:117 stop:929 length:813 start_codon:yes stop_codon:yes gene_type:complete
VSIVQTIKIIFYLYFFVLVLNSCGKSEDSDSSSKAICTEYASPPFSGTIFIDPDIITSDDPTTFVSLSYNGQAQRTMYDRRVADWITINPYLFPTLFDDSTTIEIQVNPEFGTADDAKVQAEKFAPVIGRLTTELRKDVETVWIHKGNEPFGGGNNNLLIHTEYSALNYENQGILEETLVHEASHTSLDAYHSTKSDWIKAQEEDCRFISSYAEEHPTREDIAESYLPYFAVRYRSDRISDELKEKIESAIPNRIRYFDDQSFNNYPLTE